MLGPLPAPLPVTMYVATSLDGGGAERLLTNVILQQHAPERVRVVTMRPGGVFRPALEEAGFDVVDLGVPRHRRALSGLLRLVRAIRAQSPQIVHGWDYSTNLLVFVACFLARSRARIFWGLFGTGYGPAKLMKRRDRAAVRLNILFSRWVDGVVYNGDEVRDHHRALGFREPRSAVISNSIDADAFQQDLAQGVALRAQLGIAPDDVVVAVVARVDPQKDWATMCEAVRGLPGVVTVAIGSGTASLPPQPGLIRLGWRDDVNSVLSAADIFLLGSAFGEGISLALGEAMLCGLPCVVTDVGGNGRLVGESGIVVEPRDTAAIREAIVALAHDPERRRRLGALARARATAATSADGGVRRLHAAGLVEASN
jgi:glycosyltransferase involved in cell wall biosynthesis